jgi:hypothetical protein
MSTTTWVRAGEGTGVCPHGGSSGSSGGGGTSGPG